MWKNCQHMVDHCAFMQRIRKMESKPISKNVAMLLKKEFDNGIDKIEYYSGFTKKAFKAKIQLLGFLIDQKMQR